MCHSAVELRQGEVGVRLGVAAAVVVHIHAAAYSTGVVVVFVDVRIVAIVGAGGPAGRSVDTGAGAIAVEVFEEGQAVNLGAGDEEVDDGEQTFADAVVDNLGLIVGAGGEGGEGVAVGIHFAIVGPSALGGVLVVEVPAAFARTGSPDDGCTEGIVAGDDGRRSGTR